MAFGRFLPGKRVSIGIAFGVLLIAAFGAGCSGFFVDPTLTSITINPTSPAVQIGKTITLSAYGINSNNQGSYLTSGVSWSSGTPDVAQITGNCATTTCGNVIIQGVTVGTSTITAGDQSVTNTATLTVYLPAVNDFQICTGTFGATTTCSNGSTPLTWTVSGTQGASQNFVAQGTSNGTLYDLTTSSTWTVTTQPNVGTITCSNASVSPEACTTATGTGSIITAGTYPVTVTYTNGATATLNIVVQ